MPTPRKGLSVNRGKMVKTGIHISGGVEKELFFKKKIQSPFLLERKGAKESGFLQTARKSVDSVNNVSILLAG